MKRAIISAIPEDEIHLIGWYSIEDLKRIIEFHTTDGEEFVKLIEKMDYEYKESLI